MINCLRKKVEFDLKAYEIKNKKSELTIHREKWIKNKAIYERDKAKNLG